MERRTETAHHFVRPRGAENRRQASRRGGSAPPPGRRLPIVGAVVLGLVAALAVAFEIAYADRVMPGVYALGVSLGGLTQSEAAKALAAPAADVLDRPVMLSGAARLWSTSAESLGLRMEPAQLASTAYSVGRGTGLFSDLAQRAGAMLFGHDVGALGAHDGGVLEAELTKIAREVDRAPRDAALTLLPSNTIQVTPSRLGLTVDVPVSRERVNLGLARGEERIELLVRERHPSITESLLSGAAQEAERLLTGPLVLTFQSREWRVEQAEIAGLLSFEIRPGEPARLAVKEAPLRELAEEIAHELAQQPRDARFDWTRNGLRVIRESRDGRYLDPNEALKAIREGLASYQRRVELPVVITPPAVSSADPAALGLTELIERGSTSFAGSIPEKKHNITLAAQRLNGAVVPPGGLFSFNKEVGPTTLEAGFQWGFGIATSQNGVRTVPSVAGGICQLATTLFHPVFWGGYQLEERYWHLYWIPAYTSRGVVGLDATVDEEHGLDFKFINPTPNYLLVQAWTEGDTLHFALFGKKPNWRVEVGAPTIANKKPPSSEQVFEPAPSLPRGRRIVVEAAREGFDVTVVRRVIQGDEERALRLQSTYQPSRNVTLIGAQGAPLEEVERLMAEVKESAQNRPAATPTASPGAQPAAGAGTPTAAPAASPSPAATAQAAATSTPAPAPTPAPTTPATAAPQASPTANPGSTPAPKPQPTPQPKT